MSTKEFSGYDLAIGSVFGARQWSVDSLGRLTGVTHEVVWRDGENVAECRTKRRTKDCKAGKCGKSHQESSSMPSSISGWYIRTSFMVGDDYCKEPAPCDGVDPECGCGFWAYYDTAQWHTGPIKGVIKGYGKTTLGSKGFRCEKAEIVALCLPGEKPKKAKALPPPPKTERSRWDRFSLWADRNASWTIGLGVGLGTGSVMGLVTSLAAGFEDSPNWFALTAALLLVLAGCVTLVRASFRGIEVKYDEPPVSWPQFVIEEPRVAPIETDLLAKIRRNYPGVQFFDTAEEMFAAFPLTKAEEPTPEHPDFWDLPTEAKAMPPAHLWKGIAS